MPSYKKKMHLYMALQHNKTSMEEDANAMKHLYKTFLGTDCKLLLLGLLFPDSLLL